jgi:hypothetical protein
MTTFLKPVGRVPSHGVPARTPDAGSGDPANIACGVPVPVGPVPSPGVPAPTGRNITAQGKEPRDAALGINLCCKLTDPSTAA